MEIKNIEELLVSILKDGRKYLSHKQEKFLDAGENYGSTIVKLIICVEDKSGEIEEHNCVAKLVPLSPYIWKVFNTTVTFKKEIRIYDTVVPILRQFGNEYNIKDLVPFFGEYIGARVSLNPKSEEVDFDAALILRNLSSDGYVVCDRFEGFDKPTTELLLRDLATMHASAIAFKIHRPKEFKEKLLLYLNAPTLWDLDEVTVKKYQDQYASALRKHPDCLSLIDRVVEHMNKACNFSGASKPREPFATMVHQDLWTNNVMVKFENDRPVSCKFIDFQVIDYGNPASDVLFLIYSSSRIELLPLADHFFNVYFNKFVDVLKQLNCDISKFTPKAFEEEIYAAATDFTFVQILFMLAPIYTLKGKAKDITEMNGHEDIVVPDEDLHENFYRRLNVVVREFSNHGWI